jgi:CheY-like chemotaxis protein
MHTESAKSRVLVVDDDRLVADTLAMVLKFSGYEVDTAYSGEDAIALALAAPYDMLVSDVMMEPMNGVQAAVAIRATCPTCRVVLMSGNERTSQVLAEAAHDGLHFRVLAKPVHPTVILDALRSPTQVADA